VRKNTLKFFKVVAFLELYLKPKSPIKLKRFEPFHISDIECFYLNLEMI